MANKEATLLLRIKEAGAEALGKVKLGFEAVATAAAVVGTALVAFGVAAVKAFGESEEAGKRLTQAIKNQGLDVDGLTKSYTALAEQLQRQTVFEDDAIKSAIAIGQAMAGNIALTEDLIRATVDYAAATGTDLHSAFERVGKAIGGNATALSRELGIALDESASKSEKLAQVTDALTAKFDGFAQSQAEGLGAVKQMSNEVGDLMEMVGELLAPAVVASTRQINTALRALKDIFSELPAHVSGLLRTVTDYWKAFAQDGVTIFGGLKDVIAGTFTFDMEQLRKGLETLNQETKVSAYDFKQSFIDGFNERSKAFEETIDKQLKAEEGANTKAVDAAKRVADRKKAAAEKAKDEEISKIAAKQAAADAKAAAAADALADQMAAENVRAKEEELVEIEEAQAAANERMRQAQLDEMKELGNYASSFISGGFQDIAKTAVTSLTESFLPGFGQAAGQLFSLLAQDSEKFGESLNQIFSVKFLSNIAQNISIFAERLPELIDSLAKELPAIVQKLIAALIEASPQIMIAFMKALNDPEFYVAMVKAIAGGVTEGVVGGFKGSVHGAVEALKDIWNSIKDLFKIKVELPNVGGGGGGGKKWYEFNKGGLVPGIQKFAAGGTVDTVPAMLTPGEFVMNAEATRRNFNTLKNMNAGGSGGGGGGSVTINVYGGLLGDAASARQLAKAIDSELLKLRQANQSVSFDSSAF